MTATIADRARLAAEEAAVRHALEREQARRRLVEDALRRAEAVSLAEARRHREREERRDFELGLAASRRAHPRRRPVGYDDRATIDTGGYRR